MAPETSTSNQCPALPTLALEYASWFGWVLRHLLKFPGMKPVLSQGGAALPLVLGRLARNFTIAQGKYADPRKGFEALYFDSVVFDGDALKFLAGKAGAGK